MTYLELLEFQKLILSYKSKTWKILGFGDGEMSLQHKNIILFLELKIKKD